MDNEDPIIAVLEQEKILDASTLEAAIAQHRQTGESMISVLKKESSSTKIVSP